MFSENKNQYRERLQSELKRRQRINPSYSMRAFARDLGLNHTFLSKILSGKNELSHVRALSVAQKLGYSRKQALEFTSRTEATLLTLDAFEVVSDWYHYGVLELSRCKGFKATPRFIASRLGISKADAEAALPRLIRLGLLKQKGKTYIKTDNLIVTPTDFPSQALRSFHMQMIGKAKNALEEQTVSERDITGMTIAVDVKKLSLAKREIQKFQKRMVRLLEGSEANEVYQLNVQLFRISNPEKKEKTWDA
jgi:uncharacterized protein (TIGR02147 family)